MMSYKIYGIKNCDAMKKAFSFLDAHGIIYEFHDYKKSGIDKKQLLNWCKQVGWQKLLNTKGTTWRGLDDVVKSSISTQSKAIDLMRDKTSIIKRPVIEKGGSIVVVGFDEKEYEKIFL